MNISSFLLKKKANTFPARALGIIFHAYYPAIGCQAYYFTYPALGYWPLEDSFLERL
jgi:hypothetical protein